MKLKKVLTLTEEEQRELFWNINVVKPIEEFKQGNDTYKYIPLGQHTYKNADYIKRLFAEGSMESIFKAVSECYSINIDSIPSMPFRIFIRCLKSIKNDIEKDIEEQKKLEFFADEKVSFVLRQINADVMNQFGIYNVIEQLSGGDKTKWEYFENLKYEKIKFMLTFNTLSNDTKKRFEQKYNEINKQLKK